MENISTANYTEPTPIQMQAIPLMLNVRLIKSMINFVLFICGVYMYWQSRELFACAPTGSGKTLAFIVPILAHLKVHTCY